MSKDKDTYGGVSVTLWAEVLQALERVHGHKLCEPVGVNTLTQHLERVEQAYLALPDAPPREVAEEFHTEDEGDTDGDE